MPVSTKRKQPESKFVPIQSGAIAKILRESGRLPPVAIRIFPLGGGQPFYADRFIKYNFSSSILIPVDTFSFDIALDDLSTENKPNIPHIPVQEGDLIHLEANRVVIATGIVDSIDIQTDSTAGSTVRLVGRDLLSQFEDQDAVSIDSEPIYANKYTIDQVVSRLAKDTRINPKPIKIASPKSAYLFATQPGETKLSAFQRYTESLNVLFWTSPEGRLVVGKPNLWGAPVGRLYCLRASRQSNVLSIRATRNSTSIPNIICPIWNGQESVQNRVSKEQILENKNRGPSRLRKLGHRVPRAVVVCTPEGTAPQDLAEINLLRSTSDENVTAAGAATLLQAYGKREIARANVHELQVQIQVVGHYNEDAQPFSINQVYRVQYDIGGVDEDMFLYQVEYSFEEGSGQITNLFFCRQINTIVSDVNILEDNSVESRTP